MQLLRRFALTLCVCIFTLALADGIVRSAMRQGARLTEDFSSAFLTSLIRERTFDGKTIVLGDSVLWGYRLPARSIMSERLRAHGLPTVNIAFEGGSMANVYASLVVLHALGASPKSVLFNVNIKEFNVADSAYNRLHPALEDLAWKYLSPAERADLKPSTRDQTTDTRIDHALSRFWALYGMRSDIRERLFGSPDAASAIVAVVGGVSGRTERDERAHRPTADRFMGTYDLAPLGATNVQVRFLRRTVRLLRMWRIPAVAVITPTNHSLLHDYIDAPEYDANLRYITDILEPAVKVINLDRAFSSNEFIDNDHLTARANDRLAGVLAPLLAP